MEFIFDIAQFIVNAIVTALVNGAFLAIVYALIIMVFAAFITIYFESYIFRAIGLLVLAFVTYLMLPLAELGVIFLGLPGGQSIVAELYLEGLLFEFVGAFFILILFESNLTKNSRTFTPLAIFTLLAAAITLSGLPFSWFQRETGIEISVMLIGAFLVTMVLKREWWWDTRNRHLASAKMDKDMLRYAEIGFTENLDNSDAQIKVIGRSEGEVDLKIQRMKATMDVLGESDYQEDSKTAMISKYVAAKFRTTIDQQILQPEQIAINVRGSVNLVRTTTKRIGGMFDVEKMKEHSSPFKGEIQQDVYVTVPDAEIGDVLFEHFRDLAVTWRSAAKQAKAKASQDGDPRKQAFLEGLARAHQQASVQLVEKLDDFHI